MFRQVCAVLILAWPVAANDTMVTLAAGGLVLAKSSAIAMESEELEVSVHRISVKYVFRNRADRDEDVTVAFPLPPIDGGAVANEPMEIPSKDPLNFVDFEVAVAGRRVQPEMEVRAFFEDKEITGELRSLGLPLSVLDKSLTAAVRKLNPAARSRIEQDHWVDCATVPGTCYAYWQSRVQYYWKQRFPAGAAVEVKHTYKPVVGGTFIYPSGDWKAEVAPWCGGEDVMEHIRRQRDLRGAREGDDTQLFNARWIEYILTTGANWRGSIGSFHLSILSDSPGDVMVTCFPGLRRTAPSRYELTRREFNPTEELRVMILQAVNPRARAGAD